MKKLLCLLLGHKFYKAPRSCVAENLQNVGCSRCGRHWIACHNTESMVELDNELRLYFESLHKRVENDRALQYRD